VHAGVVLASRLRGSPQEGGTLRPSLLARKEARPRSLTVNMQNVPWAVRDVPYVGTRAFALGVGRGRKLTMHGVRIGGICLRRSTPTEGSGPSCLVSVVLPDMCSTTVRVYPDWTMDDILRVIAQHRFFSFDDHTLEIAGTNHERSADASSLLTDAHTPRRMFQCMTEPGRDEVVEMDRPYTYYAASTDKPIELIVRPAQGKAYSTLYVSEEDRDVMVLRRMNNNQ